MSEHTEQSATEAVWQTVKLARHPARPHTLDYMQMLAGSHYELHGDRHSGDDAALVGGLARFGSRNVVFVGHQKGRDTRENLQRNFGMPGPEGYRKALRLFKLAEKFGLPLFCFIDTPGAYPGIHSEEQGVAQAIAQNLLSLADLRTPVISVVIGEGGSGGALAIGLSDRILMLENTIYSVASPEASAAILWRDAGRAPQAATAMRITARELLGLGLVDEIIPEPNGGAHTDPSTCAERLRESLERNLAEVEKEIQAESTNARGIDCLLTRRYHKFRSIGAWRQGPA
ncbi:MAG TPA: acetyl-CoA carboxylase carboxyltransferase subunit alpha [Chloroflexia bacterium]|nr:acetyl-CoA carboxylase carboxyltransferase subunit alpha [Chloroflexia bacterium]